MKQTWRHVVLTLLVASVLSPCAAAAADVDLAHLTFTATDPVAATLVSPEPGGFGGVATPLVVSTGPGAGVEVSVGGSLVAASHIGKREINKTTGETRYTFFGVGLEPGPNAVELTPLGAGGRRFPASHFTLFGRGPVVSAKLSLQGRLVADGRRVIDLRVDGIDRWGHPAMSGVVFDAVVRSGDVRLGVATAPPPVPVPAPAGSDASGPAPSAPPVLPLPAPSASDAAPSGFAPQQSNPELGTSGSSEYKAIADVDGGAMIPIAAGLRSGDVVIDVAFDGGAGSVSGRFYVWPYLRRPTVTGLITGGVGAVPGDPGSRATDPYEANSRAGRVALYGTGAITATMSATAAYDTAGALDENASSGSFNEDPNERPYLTYGDASQRRADALSTNHLYAQVDDGRASASYGEFEAKTGSDGAGSLGGFQLLMNGARVDAGDATKKVELFDATAGVSYGRQVVVPNGLSTTNFFLHPNIVVGSDSLTLVALDRHTGTILSETGMTRNIDYVIDYGSGTIRFINPPLAFDGSFDPQEVLVQYEYAGGGGAVAVGGRATATIGNVIVGAGYANDSTGSGNVSLFDQSLAATLGSANFRFEHLGTGGGIADALPGTGATVDPSPSTSGNAYRASLAGGAGALRYETVYQTTTGGFDDPFGGLATPGLTSLRLALTRTIASGDVALQFDSELNDLSGARSSDSTLSLKLHKRIGKRLKTTLGISHQITSSNGISAPVGFLNSGQALNSAAATPAVAPAIASSAATPLGGAVTQAEIGGAYALSPAVSVAVDRISDIGHESNPSLSNPAQTTAQLTASTGKGGQAYLRELWTDSPTQSFALATQALASAGSSSHVTQIGFDRQLGAATTVSTQYSVENAGNAGDVYAAIGVKERVFATKNLQGDLTVQHADVVSAGGGEFNLYGTTLSYDRGSRFRATSSYQLRTGTAPGSSLTLGAIGYVGAGLSAVASFDDTRAAGIRTADDRVGLAFRPQNDDRTSALFGYDHLEGVGDVAGEQTNVASLDALHWLTRSTEITTRLAYQIDGDQYYPAHSALVGLRVLQRLGPRFDIAAEARGSGVSGVAQSSVFGSGIEAGYRIGDAFRFAGGYSFAQTPDLSLAAPPRRKGFYVTFTSVVQSIFGFGKDR